MSERNGQPTEADEPGVGALRERLRIYESFDSVIAESMRHARVFLEEAANMHEQVMRELAEARSEIETEIAEARAEIAQERSQLVSIARSILIQSGNEAEPGTGSPLFASPASDGTGAVATIPAPVTSDSSSLEPEPATSGVDAAVPAPEADRSNRTTIIVHGIHRPAVATGLQRYLLAQPGVTAVEPREFAEGILRLQVHATAQIDEALFAGWEDGAGMTVIHRVPRTVEIILPSAT